MSLTDEEKKALHQVALQSIRDGIQIGEPFYPAPNDFAPALAAPGASFVTLTLGGQLRGCIGTLEARDALVRDVAKNAFQAAYHDPRFPPVSADEMNQLAIKIAVLSAPEDFPVKDEGDLLKNLCPFKDGLIIEEGHRRGTFLPAVWESLPNPRDFVSHLKQKAGFPKDYWSTSLRIKRYTSDEF